MKFKKATCGKLGLIRVLDLALGSGVLLLGLATLLAFSPNIHAETESSDSLNITLSTSCTLSSQLNEPHTKTVAPGVNTSGIGETVIKTVCNDVNGFSLYAIGYTDNTNGKTVLASDANPSYDIPTGTATSGTSNWSMMVNSVTGTTAPTIFNSFDSYHNVPSTYTKVASYTGPTDSTQGSSVTTTYAIYTTPSQMTGTYTGQVKYVMVHPSTSNGNTITYNPNGGTVSPSSEVVALGTSTILPTPTYTGFNFLGWYTAATGGTKIGDAGDTYTPTANVVLHAQWEEISDITGITRMDQMTSEICANTTAGTTASLIDDRGTSGTISYSVAKLNDGKCWMTQNLRLTYDTSTIQVSDGAGGTTSWTPERASVTGSGTNCSASWTNDYNNPYAAYCSDTTYGVYYNWTAAIASNDSSSYTTQGQVIDASICPKGWKLPQNASGAGSFYTLYNTSPYTSAAAMLASPLNFQLAGFYRSGSLSYAGSDGSYWSSTVYDSNNAYLLYLNSSSVDPQDNYNRYYGYSVRCVSI